MASKTFAFDIEQLLCVDDVNNLTVWLKQMAETAEIEKNNTPVHKYRITIKELK